MTLAVLSLLLAAVPPAHGQSETVLYSFQGSPDSANPALVTIVLDKKGNLYGTTYYGGAYCQTYGCGTVFQLAPSGTETILHSFDANGTDGYDPDAGLVRDTQGNLYGTTLYGGADGGGTVFELTPSGTETILHSLGASGDGVTPDARLVLDKKGNLYGTTVEGGAYGYGTVFKLAPSGTETVLHSFDPNGTDGYWPYAGLVLDNKGNLYGTTWYGGANSCGGRSSCGTVFKLTPSGKETILHSFGANGSDGYNPQAGLVRDKMGNLYGATVYGGAYGGGTVFKLTPSGAETILYSFEPNGTDGFHPAAGLILDKEGNLYGTTTGGGSYGCTYHYECGTVFEVTPSGTETILHSFNDNGTDGYYPYGGLVFGKKGNLYGTTFYGGPYSCFGYGCGTVFEVTP